MNKTSILILGILVAIVSFASNSFAQRTCGTDTYWAQKLADNPKNAISRVALEQSIQQWIQAHPNGTSSTTSKKVIYTIPTVVHVVYNNSTENISDAQIQSQMVVLNDDFRRTNADASSTPSWFTSVAADTEIEFCLAQQDPAGAASTGITRTSTSTTSFSTNDNIKSSSSGGKDPWPRNDYLNIWVCDLGGGLLGYATFPGGSAANDGVVIGYNYFGTVGVVSSPFNKGRTTTHEVGHWLALYHSFDGGCSGTTSSNCGTSGDRCCDTPPTSSANYNCPSSSQNTCTETPSDQNDMHMNYMDYVNDNCMNLFTLDQKARMVAVMTSSRASLQSSQGCVSTTSNALDAGISLVVSPTGTTCATTVTPIVTIENFGSSTLTTATINYDVDGGANNTFSWGGSLSNGQTEDVTLPSISVSAGAHTFNSSTSSPNGGSDQDLLNDASSIGFTISGSSGSLLPFTEGFEGGTFPPSGWVLDNPEANQTFTRVTSASGFGNSSACAKMDFFGSPSTAGESDYLYTVDLDLSSASSPTVMDFNMAYTRYGAGNEDSLIIWVSTNCGATWIQEWQNGGTTMQTAADNTSAFTPTSGEWVAESVNLDTYIGNGAVQIQFQAVSGWGNNLYLDDINIYSGGGGGSAPVANFTASSTSVCVGSVVNFSDQSTNTPTSWSWTFAGGSPGSSSSQNPSVTYITSGSYAVTLVATNGTGSDSKTTNSYITVNTSPSGNMSSSNASCGVCDGSATAVGTGGSPSYTYAWNTSPQQNSGTATNLCAGSYTVTITDGNGCSGTAGTTVGSAGGVTSTATGTDASCGGCDGTGTVTGSGGTTPYTYQWSGGGSLNTVSGLCVGVYTVTVTDNGGCSSTSSITIASGGSMSSSATSTNASCGGCDGTGTVTGSGGTTPYTYQWSGGGNSNAVSGLCAGNYTVTVSDNGGCSSISSITVASGGSISASSVSNNTSCSGSCDGSASANGTGGTSPYTYAWNTSPVQNSGSAIGLCAGSYTVTVTDASGCSATSSVTVSNGPTMSISTIGSDATCNGECNGVASANATGGTSPFSYYWNSTPVQNGATATSLCAGTYGVNITDANGCSTTASVTISEPAAMVVSAIGSDASCGSADGSASASASNGQTPYTYNWSNGQTSASALGLAAGVYTVTVTDASGCSEFTTVSVNNSGAPIVSSTSTDATCAGGFSGTASVIATGGLAPYTYAWYNATSSSTSSVNGLPAGTYTVLVTDSAGCMTTEFVTIDEPAPMIVSMTYLQVSNDSTCDGFATASTSGGTGAYTYQWNDPANQTTASVNGLCMGVVNVTVTDNNGCTSVSAIYVDSIVMSVQEIVLQTLEVAVYPNPSSGEFNVRFSNGKDKNLRINVYDLSGKLIIDEDLGRYSSDVFTMDLSAYKNGIYFLRVIEDNSFVVTKKISLIR